MSVRCFYSNVMTSWAGGLGIVRLTIHQRTMPRDCFGGQTFCLRPPKQSHWSIIKPTITSSLAQFRNGLFEIRHSLRAGSPRRKNLRAG